MAVCKVTVNPVLVKFSPAKTGWVTSDALKSRTGPGTNYSAAGTFSKDAKVTVIGEIGEWYKLGNGKYVNAKYITFTKPVDTQSEIDKKAVAKVSGKKAGNVIGDTKAKWYAYSATFNRFSRPQCTWYAKGRVGEVLNYNITYVTPMNGNLWVKNATGAEKWNSNGTKPAKPQKISIKKEYDVSNVKSYSIMSYKNDSSYTSTYGHVVFIEAVERDSKGKPKTIYYTDGGSGYSTQGALKIKTYSGDFQKYCGGGIVGYIQFN
jgi:hypothetical protein